MTDMFFVDRGRIVVRLTVEDKALLVQIPDLIESVKAGGADPAHAILNRDAHRDDDEASREFAALVASQRDTDRAKDLVSLLSLTADSPVLDPGEASAALRAISAARLTLAARAGAFEEGPGWELRIADDPGLAAVAWLGYVQSDLVEALEAVRDQTSSR